MIKPIKRKIITIGESQGITIPKWLMSQLDLNLGDSVIVSVKKAKK